MKDGWDVSLVFFYVREINYENVRREKNNTLFLVSLQPFQAVIYCYNRITCNGSIADLHSHQSVLFYEGINIYYKRKCTIICCFLKTFATFGIVSKKIQIIGLPRC